MEADSLLYTAIMTDNHPLSSGKPASPRRSSVGQDLWFATELAWNLGFIIAIPAVAFGFSGAYLDRWLHTSPAFLLLGLALALALSMYGVLKRIRQIVARPR